jgi:hypothetical protein
MSHFEIACPQRLDEIIKNAIAKMLIDFISNLHALFRLTEANFFGMTKQITFGHRAAPTTASGYVKPSLV